jgi:hypothetical protein
MTAPTWPAEARLLDVSRHQYPTVREGWLPVLFVSDDGLQVWLETIRDRPVAVTIHCVETRGEQAPREDQE